MPTIITSGAASAQGFGGQRINPYFFNTLRYSGINTSVDFGCNNSVSDGKGNTYYIGTQDYSSDGVNYYTIPSVFAVNRYGVVIWKKIIDDDLTRNYSGVSIAYGPSGHVYVLITPKTLYISRVASLYKLRADTGGLVTLKGISGSGGLHKGLKIALDAAENVYVCLGANLSYDGILTLKFDDGLNLQWDYEYRGTGADYLTGVSLAVDTNGNVYAVGQYFDPNAYSKAGKTVLVKYSTNGFVQWARGFGTSTGAVYFDVSDEKVSPVAVDGEGNVYLYGAAYTGYTPQNYLVKLNSSGTIQWQRLITEGYPKAVCCDPAGNVYILSGNQTNAVVVNGYFPTITKVNSSGSRLWTNYISRTNRSNQTIATPLFNISATNNEINVVGWLNETSASARRVWDILKLPADGSRLGKFTQALTGDSYYFTKASVDFNSTNNNAPSTLSTSDFNGPLTTYTVSASVTNDPFTGFYTVII
jgi:hypothetical protein